MSGYQATLFQQQRREEDRQTDKIPARKEKAKQKHKSIRLINRNA